MKEKSMVLWGGRLIHLKNKQTNKQNVLTMLVTKMVSKPLSNTFRKNDEVFSSSRVLSSPNSYKPKHFKVNYLGGVWKVCCFLSPS